jgi:hypothetical protein
VSLKRTLALAVLATEIGASRAELRDLPNADERHAAEPESHFRYFLPQFCIVLAWPLSTGSLPT